jgi:hypothetical protein
MHRLIVTLAATLVLTAAARPATACSCAGPMGCGADDATVLFVGRILDLWNGPDRVVARFEVERAAKGVYARQIVSIQTGPGGSAACSLDFHLGGRWLIAAHEVGEGRRPRRRWVTTRGWGPVTAVPASSSGMATPARCSAAAATSADASSDPARA